MKQQEIFYLAISSFILVLIWIGFNIYHISITSTIPETVSVRSAAIAPVFDTKELEALKKRRRVLPFESSATISASITPTQTPLPTPTLALPTPTIATSSGIGTQGGTLR